MSIQSEINRINSAKAAIGAAIAEKGTTVPSGTKIDGMAALVAAITTGIDTSDATAAANTILSGYTAYVKGAKITGTIASQGAQTITPGTSDKTIASGKYLSGTQTIKGDANLKAENIAKGVSIFGVAGSLEAGGGDALSCTFGSITPTTETKTLTVTHNLGVKPKLFLMFAASHNTNTQTMAWVSYIDNSVFTNAGSNIGYYGRTSSTNSASSVYWQGSVDGDDFSRYLSSVNEATIAFNISSLLTTGKFGVKEYKWYAFG